MAPMKYHRAAHDEIQYLFTIPSLDANIREKVYSRTAMSEF